MSVPSPPSIILLSIYGFSSLYKSFNTSYSVLNEKGALMKIMSRELHSLLKTSTLIVFSEVTYKLNLRILAWLTLLPLIISTIITLIFIIFGEKQTIEYMANLKVGETLTVEPKYQEKIDLFLSNHQ